MREEVVVEKEVVVEVEKRVIQTVVVEREVKVEVVATPVAILVQPTSLPAALVAETAKYGGKLVVQRFCIDG